MFAGGVADGVDVVPLGPELTAPQLPLDDWLSPEYLSGCDAFDNFGNVSRADHRYGLNQEVRVIFVYPDFHEVYVVALLDFQADVLDFLADTVEVLKHVPPVLYGANQVVQEQ